MITCRTCAVEYDEPTPDVCPICVDERQYVPESGQAWASLEDRRREGARISVSQFGPRLWGLHAAGVGIGQTMLVLVTEEGSLLWDPLGYIDDETVAWVRGQGPVAAIAASHPHMYGVQVEWSRALDGAPILVNEADKAWLGRRDDAVTMWSRHHEVLPGLVIYQVGGHFPGSAVAHSEDDGGLLLAGDTIMVNPDRATASFMRSYPNRLPLSAAVVARIAERVMPLRFEQI
nr:MBL fold metallo-hydrolase [Phytoactinopolyspora halotolerans]